MRAIRLVCAALVAVVAAFSSTLVASGCDDGNALLLCGEIPANGCPLGRGGSCDDQVCAALYDCEGGKWTLAVDCSGDAGTSATSGSAGDSGPDAPCTPVALSHAGELTGCEPALEEPDCPAAVADGACAESACLTGCIDFYLCVHDPDPLHDRGWSTVAYCDEDGQLVIAP